MSFASGPYTITLGGGALLAGARTTGTVTAPGARNGMHVQVTPQSDLGAGAMCGGFVSSNDTVTVFIMGILALTPPSTVLNVSVMQ